LRSISEKCEENVRTIIFTRRTNHKAMVWNSNLISNRISISKPKH